MTEIQDGDGLPPLTSKDIKLYEHEYKKGAQLFQRALEEYVKSDNIYQQEEFHQVMNKSMNILNETARGLNRKKLLEHNEKIEKDFAAFSETPKDMTAINQLKNDLNRADRLT